MPVTGKMAKLNKFPVGEALVRLGGFILAVVSVR